MVWLVTAIMDDWCHVACYQRRPWQIAILSPKIMIIQLIIYSIDWDAKG